MAETVPQTFSNHRRFDPLFHFFLIPVFALAMVLSLVHLVGQFADADLRGRIHGSLLVILATALLVAVFKIRLYALRVQDRIIRLEERLRLSQVLSEPLRSRICDLSQDQLIGLWFASDGELPGLVERCLTEKLSRADIKKQIKNWRPDYSRV